MLLTNTVLSVLFILARIFILVFMHTLPFQAIKLEKILHDRNSEIDALKARLTSEMSCTEESEVMNTPPPKVSSIQLHVILSILFLL